MTITKVSQKDFFVTLLLWNNVKLNCTIKSNEKPLAFLTKYDIIVSEISRPEKGGLFL